MRTRVILPLLAIAAIALLGAAAPAGAARYTVGLGEQSVDVFNQPAFHATGIKRMRYLVPWNWRHVDWLRGEVEAYVDTATARGKDVFVTFTARRGCWSNNRYSKRRSCRAPSVKRYKREFRAFRKRFPAVRTFAPWNEANHKSQPTAGRPRLAARYYNAMRKVCRRSSGKRCKIVALDILDQRRAVRYLKKFRRKAKGKPRLWGLHNYSDVNRKRSRGTRAILRVARGRLWLTETGGVVKFGRSFPYSERRAARRTRYMFRLAGRYSKRRRGMRGRIARIYPYSWFGEERGARFDAGLVDPDGSPRPALRVFEARAAQARR